MPTPSVDVVIPTVGSRPNLLAEAIASVERQSVRDSIRSVYVVDDRDKHSRKELDIKTSLPICIVGRDGSSDSPREIGVRNGSSDWVAFLDDDDIWEPEKLKRQLEIADSSVRGELTVISSRVTHHMEGPIEPPGVPGRLIGRGQPVADYLFLQRGPRADRASLFTSTLLVSRPLAERVAWHRIPRHQDWDWLIRADSLAETEVIHHPDILVRIRVGSPGSISRSTDWEASLNWALGTMGRHASSQTTANFLASQTLRYAIASRSLAGIRQTIEAMRSLDSRPSAPSLVVGGAGLLPRGSISRLLSRR